MRKYKACMLALVGLQLIHPLLATAAPYELKRFVRDLVVTGPSGNTPPPETPAAQVQLSSHLLSYGAKATGTTTTQSVLLTNTGTTPVSLQAPQSNLGDFVPTTNCGTTLDVGQFCSVSVDFTPSTSGTREGVLSIGTSAGVQSATLQGTGLLPGTVGRWATATLDFAGVLQGSSSTRTVALFNDGTQTANWSRLVGVSAGVTADASGCGQVAPGSSCTVGFTFAPTSTATYSASGIKPETATSSSGLTITGRGVLTQLDLSSGALGFGDQAINTESAVKTVQIQNVGATSVSVGSLTVSGPYTATTDCTGSLAAGATCNVNVTFWPKSGGNLSGLLSLGSQTVALSGFGVTPLQALLSSDMLSVATPNGELGSVALNASKTLEVYILRGGNRGFLDVSGALAGSEDFQIVGVGQYWVTQWMTGNAANVSSCGASVTSTSFSHCVDTDSSPSIIVYVRFTPTGTPGPRSATLSLAHNGTNESPLVLNLTGTATGAPVATLSTASVNFGDTNIGDTTKVQAVRLTNTGNLPLSFNDISVTGSGSVAYAATTNCAGTLAAGAFCDTNVSFSPTQATTQTATLSVSTELGTQNVSLSGTGQALTASGVLASGGPGTVTVTTNALTPFVSPTTAALYSGQSLVATSAGVSWDSAAHALSASFASMPAAGTYTLAVFNNASPAAVLGTVPVTVASSAATLSAAAGSSANFGAVDLVLGQTATRDFVFRNIGSQALTGVYVNPGANAYTTLVNNTCGTQAAPVTLAGQGSCTFSVTYAPTTDNTLNSTLSVLSSAANSPATLNITGLGATSSIVQVGGVRYFANGTYATSCNAYLTSSSYKGTTGDGVYRINVGGTPTDVACDMTTDGGGWTRVIGINAANRNHLNTAAVAWTGTLGSGTEMGKLSDAAINALKSTTSGSTIAYRLVSTNGGKSYFPGSCVMASTTRASANCGSYVTTYTATPVWGSANTADGCNPLTYYIGLSSYWHPYCNGTPYAGSGNVIFGRTGNANTNGMVSTGYAYTSGAVWVK